ncbi:hypothetical protein ACWEQ7_22045 [Streptomyces sp. NPDC004069]
MALAELADIADRLGRDLTEEETRQATALIEDATAMILDRFPRYAAEPTATSKAVCRAMVLRVLQNPQGLRQESIDDYQVTYDAARSAGELYISDAEAEMLRPPLSSAFSIVPMAPRSRP